MTDTELVRVEPWVVLAAIRYGLPRVSYAHAESLDLIAVHERLLGEHGWAGSVLDDLRLYCDQRGHHQADQAHRAAWLAISAATQPEEAPDG